MKPSIKRSLIFIFFIAPLLLAGWTIRHFQILRANEIDFIIWANGNQNDLNLSEDQLKQYITECSGIINTENNY